eukprot:14653757-Ditylum_brightwellii.AAC.1
MPTWDSIRVIHLQLNANAASVPSDFGGGQYGHLGLTIGGAEYQTLTGHPFVRLANPGMMPPPGNQYELPSQRADRIRQWEDAARAYKLCNAVDTALRNQLTGAVDETYILSLKNQYTGY